MRETGNWETRSDTDRPFPRVEAHIIIHYGLEYSTVTGRGHRIFMVVDDDGLMQALRVISWYAQPTKTSLL